MSSEQLVLEAVKQKNSSKTQSVLQKLFALWFDAFVYNQIWEDPRIDGKSAENNRCVNVGKARRRQNNLFGRH